MLHSSGPKLGKSASSKRCTLGSYLFPGVRPEPLNIHGCTDPDSLPARLLTPPAPASTDKSHHHSLQQALTPQLKLPGLVLPGGFFPYIFMIFLLISPKRSSCPSNQPLPSQPLIAITFIRCLALLRPVRGGAA